MSFTYDASTSIGKVRLLIGDHDSNNYVLEDEEISSFLNMAEDNVYLASAFALRSIATNEAKLIQKYIKTKRFNTNNLIKLAFSIKNPEIATQKLIRFLSNIKLSKGHYKPPK